MNRISHEAYAIALSKLKGLTPEIIKKFPDAGVSLEDFFNLSLREILSALNISRIDAFDNLNRQQALAEACKDWEILKKHHVNCIFLLDEDYPFRLYQIPDPPVVIYKLGDADLDGQEMISIVGTRKCTPYGTGFCENIIEDLAAYFPRMNVISGLAYGIDSCAHKASLKHNLPTVGVMAHGLDMIYPAQNRNLAKEVIKRGGALISEYGFGEKPYRRRFLERNRIVAGLSDAVVVVESDIKGGAMSTANIAFSYSREVLALPGRISDTNSAGCNLLIRKEKARLVTSALDIMEATGWQPENIPLKANQRNLFPELDGNEKVIYDLLRFSSEPLQVDQILHNTHITMPELLSLLGELEFEGIITKYPGNRFAIT